MMKRANGEGTITLRGDGRWMVRVLDKSTGKRRWRWRGDLFGRAMALELL